MLRQIIIPSRENPAFNIPPEFYGMEVEVLILPSSNKNKQNPGNISEIFARYLYSFKNYKFDRDEANKYE